MKNEVRYKDGFFTTQSMIAQQEVGAICLETLNYDHQQETYFQSIKLYKYPSTDGSWGKKIWEGTLAELLDFVDKAVSQANPSKPEKDTP